MLCYPQNAHGIGLTIRKIQNYPRGYLANTRALWRGWKVPTALMPNLLLCVTIAKKEQLRKNDHLSIHVFVICLSTYLTLLTAPDTLHKPKISIGRQPQSLYGTCAREKKSEWLSTMISREWRPYNRDDMNLKIFFKAKLPCQT